MTQSHEKNHNDRVKKMTKESKKYRGRIAEIDLIIKKLYEDNVLEKITDERFHNHINLS